MSGPRVEIVSATREHALALAPLLRAQDVEEGRALGLEPEAALLTSLESSELAYAVLFDDEVAYLFGVVPMPDARPQTVLGGQTMGQLWMLSGRAVAKHPKAFLRSSRWLMPKVLARYGCLFNIIDARYTGALRWAEWLGCELLDAVPVGPLGLPFHPFVVRA